VAQQLTDGARAVHAAEAALHAGLTEDSTECPRVTHPRDGDLGQGLDHQDAETRSAPGSGCPTGLDVTIPADSARALIANGARLPRRP
jgi:hypothetical protein